MASAGSKLRMALIQMAVSADKGKNVERAVHWIRKAHEQGARLVALPEIFNSPYGNEYFPKYAEPIPGPTTDALSKIANELGIHLIGGSIPEEENGKLFNTCTVFNPEGKLVEKFRKVHLFDIDIPGQITFKESDSLTPGDKAVTVDVDDWKVGLGICYDIRFPKLAARYANEGCHLLVYPGAFNFTTGPAHWELLCRARAVDNQLFVCCVSPATDNDASYKAWGHSLICDPFGTILASAGHDEEMLIADLDLAQVDAIRSRIPVRKQQRPDVY